MLGSSAASTVINALLGFLILPTVLRGIHIQEYGEWATIAALLAVGQLAQAGVGVEISRRVAAAFGLKDRQAMYDAVRQGTTVLLGVGLCLEILGIGLAGPVTHLVFRTVSAAQRGQLQLLIIGVVTLLAVGLVANGYFAVLVGLQRGDYFNWSLVPSLVVAAAITVIGIRTGMGLWALFLADAVQLMLTCVGPAIGIRRLVPELGFRLVRISPKVVVGFIGMPAMAVVASLSDLFDNQVDKLVLAHTVGPGSSGVFQIAANVVAASKGVAVIPLAVLFAGTAELHGTNPARLARLERFAGSSSQAIAAVATGGFLLYSRAFVRLWLGPGYGKVSWSLELLSVAVLLNVWTAPWSYYAIGRGRYYYVLIAAGVTAAVNLLATILLTAHIGIDGALIGSIAGAGVGDFVGWLIVRRWDRRSWWGPAIRATGIVGLVAALVGLVFGHGQLSWGALVAESAVYLVVCGTLLLVTRSLPARLDLRRFPFVFLNLELETDTGVKQVWKNRA